MADWRKLKIGQKVWICGEVGFFSGKGVRKMDRQDWDECVEVYVIGVGQRCEGAIEEDGDYDEWSGRYSSWRVFTTKRRYRVVQVRKSLSGPIIEALPEQVWLNPVPF